MKNIIKLALACAALLVAAGSATEASAQKFGYINSEELMASMPEVDSVTAKVGRLVNDVQEILEAIEVEYNNKALAYQEGLSTMSESMKQMKQQELQELGARYQTQQSKGMEDVEKMRNELLQPVYDKATNAITEVGKANGFTAVFDLASGAVAYFDEATMTNVLPLVKQHLGIAN